MENNFDNQRPIYLQIVEKIKLEIVSGKLNQNDKLKSVRDLASDYKVNPNTIQKALQVLEDEKNLIYTLSTNGKFVTSDLDLIQKIKEVHANEITLNYSNNMKQLGFSVKQTIDYLKKMEDK